MEAGLVPAAFLRNAAWRSCTWFRKYDGSFEE